MSVNTTANIDLNNNPNMSVDKDLPRDQKKMNHSTDIAELRHTMEQQHLQQMKLKQMSEQGAKETVSSGNSASEHVSDDNMNSPPSSNGTGGPKIINFKNNIQQTTTANPDVLCSNCGTTKTPLWRRDERGYILCNACGLFFKLHGKPRPISLKTDVIRSRNRKTKIEKQKEKDMLTTGPGSASGNAVRKRKSKKFENIPVTNMKANGLISSAALLGIAGNSSVNDNADSTSKNSAGSTVYSQSNGLIKIVPKSDGENMHPQQSLNQSSYPVSNGSYTLSGPGNPSSIQNNKIIVLPQKHNSSSAGNQLLSLAQMGASPRLSPLWQQPGQTTQIASFKSPPMLAIDKLASVSRQINKPVANNNDIPMQPLGSSNTVLPPISHFQETQSPASNMSSQNKLPNLKNILSSVNNVAQKALSISSVLSGDSACAAESSKDEQIKRLMTENKELELKLDICKNKIQELEQKLLNAKSG